MMHRAMLSLLALLLGSLFTAACDSTDNPVAPELLVETEMVVNHGEDPVELSPGEGLFLALRFTTVDEGDIEFDFATPCRAGFRVLSGDQVVMEYPVGCSGEPANLMIRAIGVTELTLGVPTTELDMANLEYGSWLYDGALLAPGEYTVRAGLLDNEGSAEWQVAKFEVLAAP